MGAVNPRRYTMTYASIKERVAALVQDIVDGDAPGEGGTISFAVALVRSAVNEVEREHDKALYDEV